MSRLRLFQENKRYTKKEASKLVHEYLLKEVNEPDEEDVGSVLIFKDVLDCNACINHVAQVYLKGICGPDGERVYGMERVLDTKELIEIEERVFDVEKRSFAVKNESQMIQRISMREVGGMCDAKRCDVRSRLSFQNDPKPGFKNVPLSEYALNPHCLSNDLFQTIVFGCERGANAYAAAEYAIKAGYKRVYVTSFDELLE